MLDKTPKAKKIPEYELKKGKYQGKDVYFYRVNGVNQYNKKQKPIYAKDLSRKEKNRIAQYHYNETKGKYRKIDVKYDVIKTKSGETRVQSDKYINQLSSVAYFRVFFTYSIGSYSSYEDESVNTKAETITKNDVSELDTIISLGLDPRTTGSPFIKRIGWQCDAKVTKDRQYTKSGVADRIQIRAYKIVYQTDIKYFDSKVRD